MTSHDLDCLAIAGEIAKHSDYSPHHVGCVITYKHRIIATGCNSEKTHPLQTEYNRFRNAFKGKRDLLPKIHAEIKAISRLRNLDLDMRKVQLYVCRLSASKKYALARPCPSCFQAIKDLGIRHIFYTTDAGYAEEHLNA